MKKVLITLIGSLVALAGLMGPASANDDGIGSVQLEIRVCRTETFDDGRQLAICQPKHLPLVDMTLAQCQMGNVGLMGQLMLVKWLESHPKWYPDYRTRGFRCTTSETIFADTAF